MLVKFFPSGPWRKLVDPYQATSEATRTGDSQTNRPLSIGPASTKGVETFPRSLTTSFAGHGDSGTSLPEGRPSPMTRSIWSRIPFYALAAFSPEVADARASPSKRRPAVPVAFAGCRYGPGSVSTPFAGMDSQRMKWGDS
jgi:hypothetical protein